MAGPGCNGIRCGGCGEPLRSCKCAPKPEPAPVCICGQGSPASYEGELRDCPMHGEPAPESVAKPGDTPVEWDEDLIACCCEYEAGVFGEFCAAHRKAIDAAYQRGLEAGAAEMREKAAAASCQWCVGPDPEAPFVDGQSVGPALRNGDHWIHWLTWDDGNRSTVQCGASKIRALTPSSPSPAPLVEEKEK